MSNQYPNKYVLSSQVNDISPEQSKKILNNLTNMFTDPLILQNWSAFKKDDPGFVNAKYIKNSLNLHFSLDAPISIIEQSVLLQTWAKLIQAVKSLPSATNSLISIPIDPKEKIASEIRQINQLLAQDEKRAKEVERELHAILQRLKEQQRRPQHSSYTSFENEMSSSGLIQTIKNYSSVTNRYRTNHKASFNGESLIYGWQMPNIQDLKAMLAETRFVSDKMQTMMQDIGQEYAKMKDAPEVVYDFSNIYSQLKKEWRVKLQTSIPQYLQLCIDQEAKKSETVWNQIKEYNINTNFYELEREILMETIKRLRTLPQNQKIIVYVDENSRWFAAKSVKQSIKQAILLPSSIGLSLANVYTFRQSKCDMESQKELELLKMKAQKDFQFYFQKNSYV